MKKLYSLSAAMVMAVITSAQLTVTTNPSSSTTICNSNSVSITASATPISYTMSTIMYAAYDPSLFGTTILVDDNIGTYSGIPNYFEPLTAGNLDDGRWDNIALPFTFRFYGTTFNTIHITTNGWIGFGSTNSTSTGLGAAIPAAAVQPASAAVWAASAAVRPGPAAAVRAASAAAAPAARRNEDQPLLSGVPKNEKPRTSAGLFAAP